MLERVNETSKHRTGSAVVVYLQLPTKSRGDKFSRDACDDIASTLGAFARNITCDHYPSKTSRLWSRRWQSKGNDFGTLNKVLADDEIEEVLKHYYIRTGGNFRALDLILRNVPREGQKGADAVIKQVEQWGGEGGTNWKEIGWPGSEGLSPQGGRGRTHGVYSRERRGDRNEVEASPWEASRLRPDESNQVKSGFEALAFHRQALSRGWAEVQGCRIHVSFAGERNCGVWDVLWVSHPRLIFTHCMHNRRYPTLVSMIPRYQHVTINDIDNLVSMIPWYQYPSINDTQSLVSILPRYQFQVSTIPTI